MALSCWHNHLIPATFCSPCTTSIRGLREMVRGIWLEWREVAKEVVVNFNNKIFSEFKKEEMETFFAILKKINKIIDETK